MVLSNGRALSLFDTSDVMGSNVEGTLNFPFYVKEKIYTLYVYICMRHIFLLALV